MRILAVGAHPDDVELGCGGTLALLKKNGHKVHILVLTRGEASGDPETREKECRSAAAAIGADQLSFGDLRDTCITDGIDTIKTIENTIDTVAPDILITHSSNDAHQDHRNTHLASLSAARRTRKILLYESPAAMREFCPQAFVDIAPTMELKLKAVAAFKSQASKSYMRRQLGTNDTCASYEMVSTDLSQAIAGLARFRGFQAGVALAEAFEVAKYVFEINEQ